MNFRYHPMCGKLKLSRLVFADDLLLFSKGDTTSIMILLRAFATFTAATGLHMNTLKSNIYFNGVVESVKQDILQVSGFVEGTLHFKYLGVPISAGRLSVKHYSVLIEKINARIRGFGAKKPPMLGDLHWKVEALCRNYLWDGSPDYIRVPMVSWEKYCTPKCEGGLGLRDNYAWNVAAIAICKVKGKYSVAYHAGHWCPHPKGYTVSNGYEWIRTKKTRVPWAIYVWNTWCLPKHNFVNWLISRKALMLKDRLASLGISTDDKCLLCGIASETHEHFFQHCGFTKLLIYNLMRHLNIRRPGSDALLWVQNKPWSVVKKNVVSAFLQAGLYAVWIQRNKARVDFTVDRPEVVAQATLKLLKLCTVP
ncbi:uncharacterized protein LOC141638475 [Silene latifolia]|uniref:uncharacterized protein LOC141638475 n=1 Tax=Silene latifolia TaxID=37657 RepID=UPI003D76C606